VSNFKAVSDLIVKQKAGIQVHDEQSLLGAIHSLLTDVQMRNSMIVAGRCIIDQQAGAMKQSADLILEQIWKSSPV
jgi:3-deoxy-D-manno-octulosonic-acid transferase